MLPDAGPVPTNPLHSKDRERNRRLISVRPVGAERLLSQIIPAAAERPCPASFTYGLELANAAFACEVASIPQRGKERRVAPYFREALTEKVPCCNRQITAWINLTFVRNEANSGTSQATTGHGVHGAGGVASMAVCRWFGQLLAAPSCFGPPLSYHAEEMRRAGCL